MKPKTLRVIFWDEKKPYLSALIVSMALFLLMYLSVMFIIMEGKFTKRIFSYILLMPIYNLTWVPIVIQGFKDRSKKDWVHTLHTRAMDINEIESLKSTG